MFKYSKDGVSVLTILDTRRAKINGLFPVKVQVVFRRKQKYYSTGKELSKEDWDRLLKAKSQLLMEVRTDIESSFSIIMFWWYQYSIRQNYCGVAEAL